MKKKIFMLLALVMTAMTASAVDAPTYSLTKADGAEAHGTMTITNEEDEEITTAAEGEVVTVTIAPDEGWSAKTKGQWIAAIAAARGAMENVDMLDTFDLTPVQGQEYKWTFTMERADAEISATYMKVIQESWVEDIDDETYNTMEHKPDVVVKDGDTELVKDVDYTVEYINNIDAGTATAIITAVSTSDKYAGSVRKDFTINDCPMDVTAQSYYGTYDSQYHGIQVTVNNPSGATVMYGSTMGSYPMTVSPTYCNAGEYTVYFQVTKTNYVTYYGSAIISIGRIPFNVSFPVEEVTKMCDDEPFTIALSSSMACQVTYTSSDKSVATVDGNGTVTIHKAGKTAITGTAHVGQNYQDESDYYWLEVEKKVVTDTPGTTIIFDGEQYNVVIDENLAPGQVIPEEVCDAYLSYVRLLDKEGKTALDDNGTDLYLFTVCLPFTPKFNAKYYTLTGVGSGTLRFDEIEGAAKAFTPYLVSTRHNVTVKDVETVVFGIGESSDGMTEEEFDSLPYTNKGDMSFCHELNEPDPVDGYQLRGTLHGMTNADAVLAGAYILQPDGRWGAVKTTNTAAYIPPFRAYVAATDGDTSRTLGSSVGNSTGIERIVTIDRDGTEHWYDLQGRTIAKPTKQGIYIHNGKKVKK